MKPLRAAYLVPLAMLTVFAAGCAGGSDTSDPPKPTEPGLAADLVELDGVRFDVRRDPG